MAKSQQIDWSKVEGVIRKQIEGIDDQAPFIVKKFSAGYSNLTYLVKIGDWEAVLRRPPFGPIPPKAHNMEKEYHLLKKVSPVFPLAPKPYLYCDDKNVMERHFYIMEKKDGYVVDDSLPKNYETNKQSGKLISESLVDTLLNLHAIDIQKANLMDIGRPDGYLQRQVNGWIKRYHRAKTDDIIGTNDIEKWLLEKIPSSPHPTIVHNDLKLNNVMFSKTNVGEVVGVFDWELCTIGDPLSDFASTLAYWTEPDDEETGLSAITRSPNFYSRRELVEAYSEKSSLDLSSIDYYLTFAFYKVAAILQQIYYRWKIGEATDERFAKLETGAKNLMAQADRARKGAIL